MPIETDATAVLAALERVAGQAVLNASAGSIAAAEVTQVDVQQKLTRLEHPAHTPTPSAPGSPPAKITGDLTSSMQVEPELGPDGLDSELRTDIDYGAIQEFGGMAGKGHRSHLPARPFLRPAVADSLPAIAAAYAEAWLDVY